MSVAGLMIVHGNRAESLRDLLLGWMAADPLPPLQSEVVLVQSNGVAQWLKLALAASPSRGGHGIAAAIDAQLPARFLWHAYRCVLGRDRVPEHSPFDERLLAWRLLRLLPSLLHRPVFAPLRRYLDDDVDLRKRFQLAGRLASLFDQYQVYRADWLEDWALGHDRLQTLRGSPVALSASQQWQAHLWRALLDDIGPRDVAFSRANVHRRFIEAATLAARHPGPPPAGLPRRVLVFGISSLPAQALAALAGLSHWIPVLLCVNNPCEHYWADIVPDRELLRATRTRQSRRGGAAAPLDDEALHRTAQPLLAAWGRQGRDFIALLDEHDDRQRDEPRFAGSDQRVDLFESGGQRTLLEQLQDDIRDLRPLAETRSRWPSPDPDVDASIRFHVAHGPLREVEILHDQVVAALDADRTLQPRDILVMVPDIDAYAPLVQAVFGLPPRGDPRHVPFALTDRARRHQDPLLGAVGQLLDLPDSRFEAAEIVDLLEVAAVRRRFGIDEGQLPLLQRWIADAQIRWGLHEAQRESLELPGAGEQNTWRFGLARLLLGYAAGSSAPSSAAWTGVEPLDEVGGLEAEALGPLARLIETLERYWQALVLPHSPEAWARTLSSLLDDCFEASDRADGYTLHKLRQWLLDWQQACVDAGLHEAIPLAVVRDHWLAQIDTPSLGQPFFAGGVTFATLMPMRAIPFRRVCLLGMNDGDFPRTRVAMDFDLMAGDYRPGDRSRREDDRYLFLEAVLSARDHLHVSWVGRSIHDNAERPASVLVAQLRDHLRDGWRIDPGRLTVEHPLQPFSRRYVEVGRPAGLFSHAREWFVDRVDASVPATAGAPADPDPDPAPASNVVATRSALPPPRSAPSASIALLQRFVRCPPDTFLRQRLRVALDEAPLPIDVHEPFGLDGLSRWALLDELIRAQRQAVDRGDDREPALASAVARIARRGQLPVGAFGEAAVATLTEPMPALFSHYATALADWPRALAPRPIEIADADLPIAEWLGDWREGADGSVARVLLTASRLVHSGRYRRDLLLRPWIEHLAGHVAGERFTTRLVGTTGPVDLRPLDTTVAAQAWRDLLDAYAQGHCRPLPAAPVTGFAWLLAGGAPGLDADGDAGRAARVAYDGQPGAMPVRAEVAQRRAFARTYPDFDALWAQGEFAWWTDRLFAPLFTHLGRERRHDD